MAAPAQMENHATLISALDTIMNPTASQDQRLAAHKICEDFKESSPSCVEYGFMLANTDNTPVARHFGLQAVEHFIKYRWKETSFEDRAFLKSKALALLSSGTQDMLVEESHIKDGVSRIVVELMKREWPQMWDQLFGEFTRLCNEGETQTELILKVLLRLAEDIVQFQNIPTPRRRELQAALTSTMTSIFSFFLYVLNRNLEVYKQQAGPKSTKACQVCSCVLDTLSAYVDWVNITHIMDSQLLPILCINLMDQTLGLKAAECLLMIVSRKGPVSERKPLMILFNEQPMKMLLQAANNATDHITESKNYLFLKRLCEILLEIGKQLCSLWGHANGEDQGRPDNFEMYLQALVAFTQHPSQSLRQMVYTMWLTLLKHPEASVDPVFLSVIPTLIQCGRVCLHKVGYPSQYNSPSCDFSRLEFDSDEEFSLVLSNLRTSVLDSIRSMTLKVPKQTFSAASVWLTELLASPIDSGKNNERGICNLSSPSFISWDACSVFLEGVMSRLFQATEEPPDTTQGIQLLTSVLDFDTQDPLILSVVLSCVSGLFPFLTYCPKLLPKLLTKIFNAVVFHLPGQTKSTRSQAVKNVRVHACSILVKGCKAYPNLFLPEFDHLYNCVKQLDSDKDQLSQMEKIILIEALIIVSNQFHNFERQAAFLEEIMTPVRELWASQEFAQAFSSPENFMSYVGLNQPAVEPSSADTCGINRSHITYCINTILAVIKRSQWPEDYAVAEQGGFVVHTSAGANYLRNPATPHVCPLFDNLIVLLRTGCFLFKPECLGLRHPDFLKAYDLLEHDRLNILGIPPACVDNTDALVYRHPLERMQNFITALFEYGFHILGNASQYLGVEFYSTPGLAQVIVRELINSYKLLPDYRARLLIRNFLKSFMQYCPKEFHTSVAIPVLTAICPVIYQRLEERWHVINERAQSGEENDDAESQEVLDDLLVRNMTKDYLDLIYLVMFRKGPSSEVKEETAMEESGDPGKVNNTNELSELGHLVMETQSLYPDIVMCVLTGFSWSDTAVCHKCCTMLWPICKQLVTQNEMSAAAAQHTFMSVLSGLQLHGQHENCQSRLLGLAFQLYEELWQKFPVFTQVLQQIPSVESKLISELQDKLIQPQKGISERKKKEMFKKIVNPIIGTNIGQHFRRTAQYANLPRLFLESRRAKQNSEEDIEPHTLGLCELFAPADDV